MASIKIRAKSKDGVTTVKTLMSHPMETGLRKDESGKLIPAHHITEVTAEYNGNVVMSANWSGAISNNPYLSFKVKELLYCMIILIEKRNIEIEQKTQKPFTWV